MPSLKVTVDTNGLEEKLSLFTHVEAKRAVKSGVSKAVSRGKTVVKRATPVKTGLSRSGIRSKTTMAGDTARGRIFPTGPHAYITRWQDQGTGERHTRKGANRGFVEPQYMFERGAMAIEEELPIIMDLAIDAALARSGLL